MKKLFKKLTCTKEFKILLNGIWRDNPIFCMVLGICPSLAVTNKVENALAMGIGVLFVLLVTSGLVSLLRGLIPARSRIIAFMILIASSVIIVDRVIKAYFPEIGDAIGPYIGLIITNCIIMGRAEAYAFKNGLFHSLIDAFACGVGFSLTILIIASIREVLGFGTLLGMQVAPVWWMNWVVMSMAPGAFFVLSLYLWAMRTIAGRYPTN